jgi:hypothetical protein
MLNSIRSRAREQSVAVGQRYRKSDAPLIVWEVAQTFDGSDGVPYAALICLHDRSHRKTVAADALRRGQQYQLMAS